MSDLLGLEAAPGVASGGRLLVEDAGRQRRQIVRTTAHLPRAQIKLFHLVSSSVVAAHHLLQGLRCRKLHRRHVASGAGELAMADTAAALLVLHERGLVQADLRLEELDVVDGLLQHGDGVHLAAAGHEAAEHAEAVADPVPALPRRNALGVSRELGAGAAPSGTAPADPALRERGGRVVVEEERRLRVDGEAAAVWVMDVLVVIWIHG